MKITTFVLAATLCLPSIHVLAQESQAPFGPTPVYGHGTVGYVPIWNNVKRLSDSGIFQSSGNIGIGTTSPTAQLEVDSTSSTQAGAFIVGNSAASGSFGNGTDGLDAAGGNGDMEGSDSGNGGNGLVGYAGGSGYGGNGGIGVSGYGGGSDYSPGAGGQFTAGADARGGSADGIDAAVVTGAFYGYAGNFSGDLNVTGTIYAGTKDFKIDHPLDPANKFLYHASVESSEMMNIYTGNVTTDGAGEADVALPDWFEAVNTDFRYQLTVVGQFAQAIVGQEISNNHFRIRTSVPGVKVSWQVTAVRHDAYAKAHPLTVEQEKPEGQRGYFIHPDLYGAPEEKGIEWVRNPAWMQKSKDLRIKQLAATSAR